MYFVQYKYIYIYTYIYIYIYIYTYTDTDFELMVYEELLIDSHFEKRYLGDLPSRGILFKQKVSG